MGVTWGHGDYTQGNSFCKEQLQTNRENFYSSRLEAFTIPASQEFVTAGTRYCCVRSFFSKTGGFGQFCVPTSPLFGRAVYFLVQISEDKWASDEEDWTSWTLSWMQRFNWVWGCLPRTAGWCSWGRWVCFMSEKKNELVIWWWEGLMKYRLLYFYQYFSFSSQTPS